MSYASPLQMREARQRSRAGVPGKEFCQAFTLIELLVVIAIIGVLASLLLPALARAKAKAQGISCINNTHQLILAWILYADDHNGRLPYNLGGSSGPRTVAKPSDINWVNNIMDWELHPDNTNVETITKASLGNYTRQMVNAYRCPGDKVLSAIQREASWQARVRSYSMNAMMGDAGEVSQTGSNRNNPGYAQFFSLTSIPTPSAIFVFLDEHPDSINDGYFINRPYYKNGILDAEWIDLPASYHNGAASFSFADGHSESHHWRYSLTKPPAQNDVLLLPEDVPIDKESDFEWVIQHMSVRH